MHPILFTIKGITIYTYGFFLALGFLVGFVLFLLEAKRRKKSLDTAIDLAFWVLISSIIISRIFYVLVNLRYFIERPLRIFMIWEGGLVWYGAFFGAIIAYFIYFRKRGEEGWLFTDIAIPSVALGQAIGRIGCFMAGCCYGKATDLCIGVTFGSSGIAPAGVSLHPTQIYHSISEFLIFLFLFSWRGRTRFSGELFLYYLFLYGATRSVVEVFRGDPRGEVFGVMSTSQCISIIVVILAIAVYLFRRKSIEAKESRPAKKSSGGGTKWQKKSKRT